MFPEIDLNNRVINEEEILEENLGRTFLFDFKENDFILKDGKMIEVEGKEGIKIWVEKVIRTDKFKFNVYKSERDSFGTTIRDFALGRKIPTIFIESELKRELTEALKYHPMISDCVNWKVEHILADVKIKFTIILRDGDTIDINQEVTK